MASLYMLVKHLTSVQQHPGIDTAAISDFVYATGWQSWHNIDISAFKDLANAHILVERDLEPVAVITFLRSRWEDLDLFTQKRVLSISYNTLASWHILVEAEEAIYVFNQAPTPRIVERDRISPENTNVLQYTRWQQLSSKQFDSTIPRVDEALLQTVRDWRRYLEAEVGSSVPSVLLATLYNAVIFLRTVEDTLALQAGRDHLITTEQRENGPVAPIRTVLRERLVDLEVVGLPTGLLDEEKLDFFDSLDPRTIYSLLADFTRNRYFDYNFYLITRFVLPKIGERYLALLEIPEKTSPDLPLIPYLSNKEWARIYGNYYTPSVVIEFCSRFLRARMPTQQFVESSILNLACSSGSFLSSLINLQFETDVREPSQDTISSSAGTDIVGVDSEETAAKTAKVFLALLHFVATNEWPLRQNVLWIEATDYFLNNIGHPGSYDNERPLQQEMLWADTADAAFNNAAHRRSYDIVVTNPPFGPITKQSQEIQHRSAAINQSWKRRPHDLYEVFLQMGLDSLSPGGYGVFVLPYTFLSNESGRGLRAAIKQSCWIHCIADLSPIAVAELKTFVVLLIIQKKPVADQIAPSAKIISCRREVGRALQAALDNTRTENPFFSIYDVTQSDITEDSWSILPAAEMALARKLRSFPSIGDYMEVHLGYLSGADSVFILTADQIPPGENDIFVPFLDSRDISPYVVPQQTNTYAFYPYISGRTLDENLLSERFPGTWKYLQSHKEELKRRSSVQNGRRAWWQPERLRAPEQLLRPKIVVPRMVRTPRFALDLQGKYAVSTIPILYPIDPDPGDLVLRFFIAILNSAPGFWYLRTHTRRHNENYIVLDAVTLKRVPVPDVTEVPISLQQRLARLVDQRVFATGRVAIELELAISREVADLYDLSEEERTAIGMPR